LFVKLGGMLTYTPLDEKSIQVKYVSYPMLRMTQPSRNFFVLRICMFVWLRGQGFESSVNKVFQKGKLVTSKTIRYTVLITGS
jgi:hypothetical protein